MNKTVLITGGAKGIGKRISFDFAKAGYNIPKGLASMERVDKILKAENPVHEMETIIRLTQ